MERKYFLTSELLLKMIYGKMIQFGATNLYGKDIPLTSVVIDTPIKKDSVTYLSRYDKFTPEIIEIAKKQLKIKEIAGNKSYILISFLMPSKQNFSASSCIKLFEQPIFSDLTIKRLVVTVPINYLNETLEKAISSNISIEHVFDY